MALGKPIVQYDLSEGSFSVQNGVHEKITGKACPTISLSCWIIRREGKKWNHVARNEYKNELAWDHDLHKPLCVHDVLWGI